MLTMVLTLLLTFTDVPMSRFLRGPRERNASGRIDLASELVHLVHLRHRREAQLQRDCLLDSLQRSVARETWNLLSDLPDRGEYSGIVSSIERISIPRLISPFFSSYFQPTKGNGATNGGHHQGKGWGTVPIVLITILSLFCLMLIVHILHSRFRARLSPSETSYSIYPPQYYKCVPVYDTPVHRNEKIVPL